MKLDGTACGTFSSNDGSVERPAFPSLDEILHAERFRLRLREHYPDEPARRVPPWCVGVD